MKGVSVSSIQMKGIRLGINQKMSEMFQNLRRVYFSQEFYAELQKLDVLHYEDELYESLATYRDKGVIVKRLHGGPRERCKHKIKMTTVIRG